MPVFKDIEVKTFREHAYCDECVGGELLPTGAMLPGDPPKFPHKCNACGVGVTLPHHYPVLLTRAVQ